MFSSSIEEIKSRLDIVEVIQSYIKLQKAGANYRAVCPFHSEKSPSFFVSPARQIWHCFGSCGIGGDIFKFVMKIEGVEFGDALRILAQRAGVEVKKQDPKLITERQRLLEITEFACRFFEKQLEGGEARQYILKRGITEESIKKWRLGYSPDTWQGLADFLVSHGYQRIEIEKAGLILKSSKTGNYYDRFRGRIMFPIFDNNSQVIGFGGRIFRDKDKLRADGQPESKYINTPATLLYDKSRVLYGLNRAGQSIRKNDFFIIVEGYTDAIMAHQAGTENVIATSGTALTTFQLNILKRYSENLYTAFDMDPAGSSATKRGIDLAQVLGFNIKVVVMKNDFDPADIILANSKDWLDSINGAKSIHDFYFENTLSRFDKTGMEGKKSISKVLLPIIKRIPNKIEAEIWIQSLSKALGVKEESIVSELSKIKDTKEFAKVEESKVPVNLKKTRKELLEERLAILALKLPKNLEYIFKEDLQFLCPKMSNIFCHLIEKEDISEEHKDYFNQLAIRAELEAPPSVGTGHSGCETPEEIYAEEFGNCVKAMRSMALKGKLDEISNEIKKAEAENNKDKLAELIMEFNKFSQIRCDMEGREMI